MKGPSILEQLVIIAAAALAAAGLTGCGAVGSAVIKYGLERKVEPMELVRGKEEMDRRCPGLKAWIDSMYAAGAMHDTIIVRDGYRLHSTFARAERPSARTAVIMHGYSANPIYMMHIARMYRDSLGYNIWLPSARRHGESEGAAVQMGWFDRFDLLDWSAIAHTYFKDTLQVYHGISMGAAAVMNASGEDTPGYVRGFVEDCGFTNLWDVAQRFMQWHLDSPHETLLNEVDSLINEQYGWSLRENSCVDQLAKCEKPMLFIHGGEDQFVPTDMVIWNFLAKVHGYREMWVAPGSRHARSFPDHPAEYTALVRKFLKEHVE